MTTATIVGPVCESADTFEVEASLKTTAGGSIFAFKNVGAYGMSMASNYNTRGRAAEVLVDGERVHLIRERETAADQMRGERLVS